MQIFTCDGCQKQHDTEDISNKYVNVCDGCKLPFGKGVAGYIHGCETCTDNNQNYNNIEYHKSCVTRIDGIDYCNAHKAEKERALEAGTVLQKYAQEFWNELGGTVHEFKKEAGSLNRSFKVAFEVLALEVKLSATTKNGDGDQKDIVTTDEIIALNYSVSGIKSYGSRTYEVGIHNHEGALEEVASALIRSLRSKKSALTLEKRYADSSYRRKLDLAKANPNKSKRKHKLDLLKIESDRRAFSRSLASKRRKINKLSKFLVGKLAELKKVREEKKQLGLQQSKTADFWGRIAGASI